MTTESDLQNILNELVKFRIFYCILVLRVTAKNDLENLEGSINPNVSQEEYEKLLDAYAQSLLTEVRNKSTDLLCARQVSYIEHYIPPGNGTHTHTHVLSSYRSGNLINSRDDFFQKSSCKKVGKKLCKSS